MIYPNYQGELLMLASTGKSVEEIQSAMNIIFERYPICRKLDNKGFFDEEMESSVREIQRAVDIKIDGIIGKTTWDTIFAIANFILLS